MSLGDKIKRIRKSRHLTQAELASDEMTRNMISQIENGTASPSLHTLRYIASALDVPIEYLVADDTSSAEILSIPIMQKARSCYRDGSYEDCIETVGILDIKNDESYLMLAASHFELGKRFLHSGSLLSSKKHFELAQQYADLTIYDTAHVSASVTLYTALINNVQAPLLELDDLIYNKHLCKSADYELYKYLTLDFSYPFTNESYKLHVKAKTLMREKKYDQAREILMSIIESKQSGSLGAYVIFGVYTDIEQCSKQLLDYENAYRYASKRMSMLESFKS